jgi:hypothetical protein
MRLAEAPGLLERTVRLCTVSRPDNSQNEQDDQHDHRSPYNERSHRRHLTLHPAAER